MADEQTFDPIQAGAVAVQEPPKFDPVASGAVPVEQSSAIRSGLETAQKVLNIGQQAYMGAVAPGFLAEKALFPSVSEAFEKPIVSPETATGVVHAALTPLRTLEKVAFGERGEQGAKFAEKFIGEQAAGLTSPENLALAAVGGAVGRLGKVGAPKPTLGETAFGKVAETERPLAETAAAKSEQVTTQPEVAPSQPIESQIAVNKELAPLTEPPSAISEPFPSLLRSAEDERRAELQKPVPQVREAISLDELRLMRERNDLQLQNDLSKRATGSTHPAVDERLSQIDDELTNIANRELQTKGGGEINASQVTSTEGIPIPQVRQEVGGEAPLRQSGEVAGAREGGTPQAQGAVPQEPVASVTAETPTSPAATAVSTPESIATTEPTGIAERYRESEQPGSVIPGGGVTPEQARTYGQDFINKGGDPYSSVRRAQAGNTSWRDVGVARAEWERLGNEKRTAEDALEKDPNNPQLQEAFDKADDAQRKWSKDAQPILTRAGDALRAATRAYPREINSFSDFTDIVNDHYKGDVELTPKVRAELQKAVRGIKDANQEANAARTQVTEIAAKKAGGKVMGFDDLKADLKSTVENLLADCPV